MTGDGRGSRQPDRKGSAKNGSGPIARNYGSVIDRAKESLGPHSFRPPWNLPSDFLRRLGADPFAILVVDMQYFSAHPRYGIAAELARTASEVPYFVAVLPQVIYNVKILVGLTRRVGGEAIFTRVQSVTADGRDRSGFHKTLGLQVRPGSIEARILTSVGCKRDDIVVAKTAGGSFYGTNLDYILRNLRISTLIVCGVITDGCVETTVREAADRGYKVILVADACGAYARESHDCALRAMSLRHCTVRSTAEVASRLRILAQRAKKSPRGCSRDPRH